MQVKVLKPVLHQMQHQLPGKIIELEDHLIERLEKMGFVTKDLSADPNKKDAQPQAPAAPQQPALEPDKEIVDEKQDSKVKNEIEEGGSEDETTEDVEKKAEGDDIEEGGSEDKE